MRLGRGQNNWIGFRGREDLGNGASVTFNLQTRFDPATGVAERDSTFWQGETTVGFSNPTLGSFRFGRAMTPLWEEKWPFDPWYASATFYSSPMMAGFQVHASILNRRREAGRGKRPFDQFVAQLRQGCAGSDAGD